MIFNLKDFIEFISSKGISSSKYVSKDQQVSRAAQTNVKSNKCFEPVNELMEISSDINRERYFVYLASFARCGFGKKRIEGNELFNSIDERIIIVFSSFVQQ